MQTYFVEDEHNLARDLWGVVRRFLLYMAEYLWYQRERRAEGKGEGRVSETSIERGLLLK